MYRDTEFMRVRPETVDLENRRKIKRPTSELWRKRRSSKDRGKRSPKLQMYDRENMQERHVELKGTLNGLQTQSRKLKTRIKYLETELFKKDEKERPSQLKLLNDSLKKQLATAKQTIKEKDTKIDKLKKHIKVTNIAEVEKQSQVYVKECQRLKALLDEAVKQLSFGLDSTDMQDKYLQQCTQLRKLKKNYTDVTNLNEQLNEEINFWKEKATIHLKGGKRGANYVIEMKNKIQQLTVENNRNIDMNMQLSKELSILKGNMMKSEGGFYGELPQDKEELVKKLIDVTKVNGIKDIWDQICLGEQAVDLPKFQQACNTLKLDMTKEAHADLFAIISIDGMIFDFNNFKDLYFSRVNMKDCYRHISLSLQVKRYAYSELPALMFTSSISDAYTQDQFKEKLTAFPLELREEVAQAIADDVYSNSDSVELTADDILGIFEENLQTWKVLSEEEEADYDCQLSNLFTPLKHDVLKSCETTDLESNGYLKASLFYKNCAKIGANVDLVLRKYLELLFYTDKEELDIVPYRNFIQVYT